MLGFIFNHLTTGELWYGFIVGGAILGVLLSLLPAILGALASWCWAYIDEQESTIPNPYSIWLAKLFGWERGSFENGYEYWNWYHPKTGACTDDHPVFLKTMGFGACIPLILIIIHYAPSIPMILGCGYGLLRLGRTSRRLSKKLAAHCSDKNAHTKESA